MKKLLALLLALATVASLGMFVLPAAAAETEVPSIDDYIEEAKALSPRNTYERLLQLEMLEEYTAIRHDIATMDPGMQADIVASLAEGHAEYLRDFRYGAVESTPHQMTVAFLSDIHITNSDNTGTIRTALDEILAYNPDTACVVVLGDLSDNGVSPIDPANTDLDNYYKFLKNYSFRNSRGEDIPIVSVMGNHDVRGPWSEGYPKGSYEAGVEMYLKEEGVDSLCFDFWLNGYHFIMLNSAKFGRDETYLTPENLEWLDGKLSENEDGRPIFVGIHQHSSYVRIDGECEDTFDDVIARHPSAVVSTGHGHFGFGTNFVYQDGNGHFINQPGLAGNSGVYSRSGYYIADIYEGGAIFRAREVGNGNWVEASDVIVPNENLVAPTGEVGYLFTAQGEVVAEGFLAPTADLPAVRGEDRQDATYLYTFVGWDIDGDGKADPLPATLDTTLVAEAVYTVEKRAYNCVFLDADGKTELRNRTCNYGDAVRTPSVQNLFGWDLNGDGLSEPLPKSVTEDLHARAILKEAGAYTYTFLDENGDLLQSGQGKAAIACTLDFDALFPQKIFLGWDTDGNGKADCAADDPCFSNPPASDMTFTAVFASAEDVKQIYIGDKNGISTYLPMQRGMTFLTLTETKNAASPTGQALSVKFSYTEYYNYIYTPFVQLRLPQEEEVPVGYAIWISAPQAKGNYSFTLNKGSAFSHEAGAAIKGAIYFISDGGLEKIHTVDGEISIPNGFSGWMILPTETFGNRRKSEAYDVLNFAFPLRGDKERAFSIGAAVAFTCSVREMRNRMTEDFSAYSYGDTLLSVTRNGEAPATPAVYTDESGQYTFVGWDLNGDGRADTLPTETAVLARAVYDFTPANYTYRFVNEEGMLLHEKQDAYGSYILPLPEQVTDAYGVTYTVTDTGDYRRGMYLTGDITFTVRTASDTALCKITFIADGVTVVTRMLPLGALLGEAPPVPPAGGGTGTWQGYDERAAVTGDMTFYAAYVPDCGGVVEPEPEPASGCGATVSPASYAFMAVLALSALAVTLRRKEN